MKKAAVIILSLAFSLSAAFAQPAVWKVDKAHSKVLFTVSHMVISDVTGRFKDFDINLAQAKDDFTDGKLKATIKVNSIDTNNERRDAHVRSSDFFEAEKYPEITFTSTSFEKTGENTYGVAVDLTIRGAAKLAVFDVKLNGELKDPNGKIRAGFLLVKRLTLLSTRNS